jgi:hypothetical protein
MLAAGAQLAAAGQPKISVPSKHWELGLVPATSKTVCRYWVKNVGDDSLRILSVKPGCGCTNVPDFKRVLAPNDSTEIGLVFDSGHGKGNFRKSAQIITNDSTEQRISISFGGTIVPFPDSISPVAFSNMKVEYEKSGKKEKKIGVINHGQNTVKLSSLSQKSDKLTVKLKDRELKPGQSGEIEFKWRGDFEERDQVLSVTFEMSDSDTLKSRFTVPVVAQGTNPPVNSKSKTKTAKAGEQALSIDKDKSKIPEADAGNNAKSSPNAATSKSVTKKTIDKDTTKAVAK